MSQVRKNFGHTAHERAEKTGQVVKKLASQAGVDVSVVGKRWDIIARVRNTPEGSDGWLNLLSEVRSLAPVTASNICVPTVLTEFESVSTVLPEVQNLHERLTFEFLSTLESVNTAQGRVASNAPVARRSAGRALRRQPTFTSQGVPAR